jgi:hypothetical protein
MRLKRTSTSSIPNSGVIFAAFSSTTPAIFSRPVSTLAMASAARCPPASAHRKFRPRTARADEVEEAIAFRSAVHDVVRRLACRAHRAPPGMERSLIRHRA